MKGEIIQAICIESRATELRRLGEKYQAQWNANPDDLGARHNFAATLLDWAKETGNKKARMFAENILTLE